MTDARPCEHEYPSTGTFEDLICVRCGHRKSPRATGTRPTEEYLPDQAACSHRKWRRSFDILTCERCATVIDYTGPEGGRE